MFISAPASVSLSTGWTSPSNGLVDDAVYTSLAVVGLAGSSVYSVLLAANANLPSNAILNRVIGVVRARDPNLTGNLTLDAIHLGIDNDDSLALDESGNFAVIGAATIYGIDLLEQINSGGGDLTFVDAIRAGTATFGVIFKNNHATLTRTINLDYMYLELYFTLGPRALLLS